MLRGLRRFVVLLLFATALGFGGGGVATAAESPDTSPDRVASSGAAPSVGATVGSAVTGVAGTPRFVPVTLSPETATATEAAGGQPTGVSSPPLGEGLIGTLVVVLITAYLLARLRRES